MFLKLSWLIKRTLFKRCTLHSRKVPTPISQDKILALSLVPCEIGGVNYPSLIYLSITPACWVARFLTVEREALTFDIKKLKNPKEKLCRSNRPGFLTS